jgi:hypothetical protein
LPLDAPIEQRLRQEHQRGAAVDEPEFESLAGVPALREAARAAAGAFEQWWCPPLGAEPETGRGAAQPDLPGVRGGLIDLHLGSHAVHAAVAATERQLGRASAPFDLRIEVLAVAEPSVVAQDEHYALISAALMASEPEYYEWLARTIRALA